MVEVDELVVETDQADPVKKASCASTRRVVSDFMMNV